MLEQDLIKTINSRKQIETDINKRKEDFENSISLLKAQLEDLKQAESHIRESLVLTMLDEKVDTKEVDDHKINLQVKKTKQIEDPLLLKQYIDKHKKDFDEMGLDEKKLSNLFIPTVEVKDKKTVIGYTDKYEKLYGTLPDGVNIKETKFLTVK